MSQIQLNNVYLRYGEQVLFDKFNVSLPRGKVTALLGASGVGKSSLLKILAGLEHVGKDDKLHADIIDEHGKPLHLPVAYMAQEDGLLPWLSVLDNVTLGAKLRGETIETAYAEQLVKKVGLQAAVSKTPQQLSGGMRQRAALARTLMEPCDVVLMDEPFSALDAITRLRLQALAVTLLAGKTVLFITHDPLEALRIADVIYVLQDRPATLSEAIYPRGAAPRDVHDTQLLQLQAQLLSQLEAGLSP